MSYINILFWSGAFLPYIKLLPIDTDVQPTTLILAFLIFVYRCYCFGLKKIDVLSFYAMIVCIYAFFTSIVFGAFDIRVFLGYVSIFLIVFSMNHIIWLDAKVATVLKVIVFVYLVFGIIQLFVPNFGDFLIMRMHSTSDRGVTSLSPEPSYYGIMCFFLFCIIRLVTLRGFYSIRISLLLQLFLILQCLVLAKSFWGLIAFSLYFIVRLLHSVNLKRACIGVLLIGASILFLINFAESNRMGIMLNKLLFAPELLLLDASTNSRVYNVLIPLNSIFDGVKGVIGHGTGAWQEYLANVLVDYKNYYWIELVPKVMSGFGGMIFDVGFIGLLYSMWLCFGHLRIKNKEIMIQSVVIFFLMFGAIPLTFPLFSIWVALTHSEY